MGHQIGNSLCEDDQLEYAKEMLASAKEKGVNFLLPVDTVIAKEFPNPIDGEIAVETVASDAIPADLMAWIQVGDADARVPHTQSVNFADRLKNYISEENIEFSIIEGADHEDDLFYTDENLDAVFNWLDGFMKG